MVEIWKDVKEYEGLYQVSNLGNVKNKITNKILKLTINNHGYVQVTLFNNKKSRTLRVHRLVASSFIPNPDNKPQIDHIDGNKTNNNVNNLRWVTPIENMNNPITKNNLIEKNKVTQLNASLKRRVLCTTTGKVFDSAAEGTKYYNIKDRAAIPNAARGKQKTAGKLPDGTPLEWKYLDDKPVRKKVLCTTTGKLFDNITEAAEYYDTSRCYISKACLGKQKTAGKLPDGTPLEWKYI